ncbi:MAG: type II secretion system protein GspD [Candidatus Omnitrophota bacterium]
MQTLGKVIVLAIGLTLLAGVVFGQPEDMEVEIFEIKNREAKSLLPAVEHVISKEGKVTVDTGTDSIIVVDYPSNLEKISEILNVLDVPQKQVEVRIRVVDATSQFLGKIGMITGQAIIPPDKFNEILYLVSKSKDVNISSEMMVRTMSGRPATLHLAQEEVLWGAVITPESKIVTVAPIATRAAGRFLEVLPKVNNDNTITVTLRPTVSEFQEDRSIFERSVLTQVIIESGDTLAIGGLGTASLRTDQEKIPFTGMTVPEKVSEESKKVVMFLTATIVD